MSSTASLNESFIYVVESYRLEAFKFTLMDHKRDFDLLEEILGKIFQISSQLI